MNRKWSGVWVANVTPFKDDAIDVKTLRIQIERLIDAGIHGICPAGTTGEGSALSDDEFSTVVETVLHETNGKIPVVPGTGSNNTKQTVARTKLAQRLGANGALVVTPYYVKPTPDGLVRHYGEISAASDLPLMLYNIPGRSVVNMLPETVERVVEKANVAAIKECSSLPQASELIGRLGKKVSVLSGEDPSYLPFLSLGGDGIVSVAGNLVPKVWVEIWNRFHAEKTEEAQELFESYLPLVQALFIESNPIPLKAALAEMGLGSAEVRAPLAPITAKNFEHLRKELKNCKLV
jgi:4-hydroxy-tetrahydrodipicolinate synthase